MNEEVAWKYFREHQLQENANATGALMAMCCKDAEVYGPELDAAVERYQKASQAQKLGKEMIVGLIGTEEVVGS